MIDRTFFGFFVENQGRNLKKIDLEIYWELWKSEKSKCRLYMETRAVNKKLLQKHVIREYMRNIDSVSRLKFKFLSGTSGLNEEF